MDGSWKYRGQRLPLGWTLRYLPDSSPCYQNALRNYCTHDDPRDSFSPLQPRRSATQQEGDRLILRSSTTADLRRIAQFEHTDLRGPSSIRLLKWLGREVSGLLAFEMHEFEIGSAPPYVAL
ncbi:hypothetical protein K491DRAFT_141203 [Lophiostoma macrostomum CBS 122681]|uniref:Uncharacterized protein n=1 Tax=Lophiostoma macrostomum CBS 122681 TaxID=1314788 RepID=A0A6A6SRY8_9PLEO|nr:hypothetical protein K491DRAFT_141203 [Lophiostoma macrostomum CBS 122681]